jgi:hypothetical protein
MEGRRGGSADTYGAWTFFGIIPSAYALGYFSAAPTALRIREVEWDGAGGHPDAGYDQGGESKEPGLREGALGESLRDSRDEPGATKDSGRTKMPR